MDVKMATRCFNFGLAVSCKGRRYDRINAMIKRRYVAGEADMLPEDKRYQAELYDGRSNAVVIVPVSALEFPDIPERAEEETDDE